MFLDQLVHELRVGLSPSLEISRTATEHGRDLQGQGFTVSQVVHDYGDICQAITELAMELNAPIRTEDFRMLNRSLDDAIASAVTEYGLEEDRSDPGAATAETDSLGVVAREARKSIHQSESRAVASAVTQYRSEREQSVQGGAADETDRLVLARELRASIHTASIALEVIKSGRVGVAGSTGAVLNQSLLGALDLIDRLLTAAVPARDTTTPATVEK